jgi:hypothetical protein
MFNKNIQARLKIKKDEYHRVLKKKMDIQVSTTLVTVK